MGLKIKEAIVKYNSKKRKKDSKLTQKSLGIELMPNLQESTIKLYMWKWRKGFAKISVHDVNKMCKICKVDPNFLFGHKK